MLEFIGNVLGSSVFQNIVVLVVGILAKEHFKKSGRANKAKEILIIADAITDKLLEANPKADLPRVLDQSVDELMKAAKIKKAVAARAITEAYVKAKRIREGAIEIRDTVKDSIEKIRGFLK